MNMQRDPKFIKNKDKFYGVGGQAPKSMSSAKSKMSAAQKLDQFISY